MRFLTGSPLPGRWHVASVPTPDGCCCGRRSVVPYARCYTGTRADVGAVGAPPGASHPFALLKPPAEVPPPWGGRGGTSRAYRGVLPSQRPLIEPNRGRGGGGGINRRVVSACL